MKNYSDYLENLSGNILLGCDGFVDEVYQFIRVRHSLTEFTVMEKVKEFGDYVVERADGGVGLELNWLRRCSGGFTPNTGRVAGIWGLKPTLIGLYGSEHLDPAYDEFKENCNLISLGNPGLTIVYEFSDGKMLLNDLAPVSNLTWKGFVESFGEEKLKDLFADVDILGLGYWSLTPDFDNFLKGFVSQYENSKPPRRMFFDFADIKKKAKESFDVTLGLMKEMNHKIPMTISLNEHEVLELFTRVGVSCKSKEPSDIASALTEAREKTGLDELVVHTPHFAAASSTADGEAYARQERQEKVIRTAGAGDTFNGGYLCASLGELSIKERLVIANAATAFFVTNATAPTKEEILIQIEKSSDK